jgi:hypothetical protein
MPTPPGSGRQALASHGGEGRADVRLTDTPPRVTLRATIAKTTGRKLKSPFGLFWCDLLFLSRNYDARTEIFESRMAQRAAWAIPDTDFWEAPPAPTLARSTSERIDPINRS